MLPGDAPTAVVGRAAELSVLSSALDRASAAHPSVVFVEGEAGMGKSALLQAFLRAQGDRARPARVRCDAFEGDVAFSAAGLLLGSWIGDTSEIEVGRRLLAWVGDLQASAPAPVVVVVDDAQWMDPHSVRALRFVLHRLRVDRVMTVVARRPVVGADPWQGVSDDPDRVTVLRLGPLGVDDVGALASQLRAWDLPDGVAAQVVQRTGGVPLLVRAVLREGVDPADLAASGDVPSSIASAVSRMVASVDADARRMVEAAAVLDEPTDVAVLGAVARAADPATALRAARHAGLLSVDAAGAVECAHALLRDAVCGSLAPGRRRELHLQAAQWTTGDRRLTHRLAAADRPDGGLAADLAAAAAVARATRRFALAATRSLQARSVATDAASREVLLLRALIDRASAQDLDGAASLEAEAGRCAPGPMRSLALGVLARDRGDVGPARTLLHEAVAAADDSGERELAAEAGLEAAALHAALSEGDGVLDVVGHVRSTKAERVGDALTFRGLGLWQTGDMAGALRLLDDVAPSRSGASWEADLLSVRGMVRYYAGRLDESLADLDHALALTHLWRPSERQVRTYVQRCLVRYQLGEWDAAAVDASAARALAESGFEAWTVPLAHAASAYVPACRGQWDVAVERLARAEAGMRKLSSTQVAGVTATAESLMAAARQDHEAVLAVLDSVHSGDHMSRLALARSFRWVMTGRINALIELGRVPAAETELAEYAQMLARWPEGPVPDRLGWVRGRLAEVRGEPRAAQVHYAEDLGDPHLHRVPFMHAQTLQASGNLERALGNRREAIDRLMRATEIFGRLRATPYLTRCSADLAACGLRSRAADPLALTQREEDVVALVTRGLTNKEVAAQLFLTDKTVEYHLGNVYAKLGINSRRQLRRLHTG